MFAEIGELLLPFAVFFHTDYFIQNFDENERV